jgi:site-specific DNA-methyltransferase (adenine-specific)
MPEPYYDKNGFTLYNGDCLGIMKTMKDGSVDIVITSPPYGTCRSETFSKESNQKRKYNMRYDVLVENKSPEEYRAWSVEVFNAMDRVLKENRVVLYNFGLGNDGHTKYTNYDWFKTVTDIVENTPFAVADLLLWKKKSALPNNTSPNKATRIVEPVIVFCRKTEMMTFLSNKKVTGEFPKTGQKLYSPFYNIFEARNNDGSCALNKATYSTEFVDTLVGLYCPEDKRGEWTVLDPFSGTGTTGLSATRNGMRYIGIELSEGQCEYTVNRLGGCVQMRLF